MLTFLLSLTLHSHASIIINEAMIDPDSSSDTNGEWIELYNTDNFDIDINEWVIKDIDSNYHQIDNNGPLIIPSNGFIVLGRNADPGLNGGYIPDYVYSSFQLANTIDEIMLEDNSSTEVSRINYSDTWPILPGQSMAYIGTGDINNYGNWTVTPQDPEYVFGTGDYGTPGYANTIPEPSALLMWLISLSGLFACFKKEGLKNHKLHFTFNF